jgi:aryl-alcohol dehydrogenase-like predicted oxidoreductase
LEYRLLGGSGFNVPVLSFGAGTFGGVGPLRHWGATDEHEAARFIDICLDAGVNMFDSADVYSSGRSEEVLGAALKGKRNRALISTKFGFRFGEGANDVGSSRFNIVAAAESALRRLGVDHIDLFLLHGYDAKTPAAEVMGAFDSLVRSGKVRYSGVSNFSAWHIMKHLTASDRYGFARHVCHQTYYSLVGRDYEWELMPMGLDQGVGAMVWSPLGWGRLTGHIRRGAPPPAVSRLPGTSHFGPPVADDHVHKVVDALDLVAKDTGKSVPQIAINWLLQRPSIASVIIGARTEQQLIDNLGAVGWTLSTEHMAMLDAATAVPKPYPFWHQAGFAERNPFPV